VTILPPTVGAFMGLISMMRGARLDQHAEKQTLAKSSKCASI
jgi:hypothetical protein